jgi:multiple sugar transport system permease protein
MTTASPATAVPTGTTLPGIKPYAMNTRPRRRRNRRALADGLLFLGPFLLVYALFLVVPVVQAFVMSGFDWDLLSGTTTFVGFANYAKMLGGSDLTWDLSNLWLLRTAVLLVALGAAASMYRRTRRVPAPLLVTAGGVLLAVLLGIHPGQAGGWNDPGFWTSLQNTLVFTVASTPLLVVLGLVMALALNTKHRGSAIYRAAFFLPYVLPISAVTLIWSYLLNPDRGLIAGVLSWFGRPGVAFLSDPNLAMPAIIATTIWWSVGFNMVLFLAGLQDVEPSLLEAASLDGATWWQRFRYVTLPSLNHVTVLVVVTQLIASFQVFGQVYIMTKGGPGTATEVLIQHIYEAGFTNYALGYAATVSVFLFIVMAAVSAVQFRLLSRSR